MPAERVSGAALRWMVVGEWRAHPARVLTAALAIAVGVALGFAVHLINTSALGEFARAVSTVNGDADLQVRAVGARGFDEGLYPTVARVAGVADVSPVVELPASAGERTEAALTLIGLDVLRAAAVSPGLLGRGAAESPFDEQALFLSQSALDGAGLRVGEVVRLTATGRTAAFTVAGTLPAVPEGQRIGVVDIAAAQWRFGQLGRLQRLDLRLAEGADPGRVRAAVAAILPPDAQLVTRQSEARRSDSLSRAYRVNLDMLALMALLTGAFLVYSAQSLSVARRRPQFALLRVLGLGPRALLVQVLAEAAVVGTVGALAGLALGLALADAALKVLGGDLGGGYFSGARPQLAFAPVAAVVFGALGLASALLGSLLPAREAARAQPAVALKDLGDAIDPRARPPIRAALGLLVVGGGFALLPAIGELPLFGYLSIALILAGGVAAMPWLARMLLAPLQRLAPSAPSLDLALKRLWGAPSQAAIALCGVVASTSLMIAMAVMVTSFRASVEDWLLQILPADVYVHLEGPSDTAGFGPGQQRVLAAVPGVAAIEFQKSTPLRLSPERPPVPLLVRGVGPTGPDLPLLGRGARVPPGITRVWISEPFARLYHHRAGDRFTLPLVATTTGRPEPVVVAGVWRDYARQQGAIVIGDADYLRITGDALRTDAAVTLARGVPAAAAILGLRAALSPDLAGRATFAEPRQIRARALAVFDRSFAVTYLLEAIAVLVGLAGVAATVSAQTLARTREFGMLRHLGVMRRQIMAMLAAEGALLGAVGVAAGLGLGVAISQVLIHVVNPQSFHWTMQTRLPLGLFAAVAAALVAASAGTALLAGRRALSADAVRAVREDW